ncbi:Peroxiredoxin OsmC [Methylobacterium crusticola]|uniref:Peroxiredoxin OsmC n=1 Tax=Methylobacterium crusticola TaxID=1697972 RepID=A0ABQ4QTE4_9HYPH|nr:OsmC family protein [Methylobacterium crusticola]GJD47857.1 Peroxiredoxin OsmC [Methylobacterium crusticola]
MNRKATAVWQGSGKDGKGRLTTQSGVLSENPYGFNTRFENEPGTNPEELIAAAHAGCFTMALAFQLQGAGLTAREMRTEAVVTLEKDGDGFTITRSALTLSADIPGIDKAKFDELAGIAEKNCPVSKLLKAEITLAATLTSA